MELFESIMWKYIRQEKDVLSANIARKDIRELAEKLCEYETIYFVSHGSSYNASMTVAPFLFWLSGRSTNSRYLLFKALLDGR